MKVQFCTCEEWQDDLKSFIASLSPGDTDEDGDERGESRRLVEAAQKRIQAVYGDDSLDPNDLLERALPLEVERALSKGSGEIKRFNNAKEMLEFLRKLVRGDSRFWPIIKQVNVSGPYDCLEG